MCVTTKGQVIIPSNIRETSGITPDTDVDFLEDDGRLYITKTDKPDLQGKIKKLSNDSVTLSSY